MEKGIELRLALGIQVNGLAVEDRVPNVKTSGQGVAESGERFVDVRLAGDETNIAVLDLGQPEPSYFFSNSQSG